MGADFLLFSLPYAELDETRQQRLHEAIDQLTNDQLQIVAEAVSLVDQDDLPAVKAAIHAAVGEYVQLDARRDTTSCRYPTDPYWRIYTGGLSWGDLPTECCQTFDIMIACDPLFTLIEGWAREDAVKLDGRDGTPETRHSADIAGIMGCLCQALTDTVHGVAGCVIQSSDNDHHDGEIIVQIPDGQGGMDSYCIRIRPQ